MTDVPFGVLLSGGLDSSLVASITARHLADTKAAKQWGSQLHSFCVGLEVSSQSFDSNLEYFLGKTKREEYEILYRSLLFFVEKGSPDLKAGKEVADYLGTVHHEFTFTVQVSIQIISPSQPQSVMCSSFLVI